MHFTARTLAAMTATLFDRAIDESVHCFDSIMCRWLQAASCVALRYPGMPQGPQLLQGLCSWMMA